MFQHFSQPHGQFSQSPGHWVVEDKDEKDKICCVTSATVELPSGLHSKIQSLTSAMSPDEWMGYLIGKIEGKKVIIESLFIPEQEVTGESVKINHSSLMGVENVIGTIHSHGSASGEHSPSGPDNETLRQNHPLMILIGNPYYVALRLQQPCGLWQEIKRVALEIVDDASTSEFVNKARERIKPYEYESMTTGCENGYLLRGKYDRYPAYPSEVEKSSEEIQLEIPIILENDEHSENYGHKENETVPKENINGDKSDKHIVKCICGRKARLLKGAFSDYYECPVHKTDTTFLDGDKSFKGVIPK